MDSLTKMLFLELCARQQGGPLMPDYYLTLQGLNEKDLVLFELYSREIAELNTYLKNLPSSESHPRTIQEYHLQIKPLSKPIIELVEKMGFTLTDEQTPLFKKSFKRVTGRDVSILVRENKA